MVDQVGASNAASSATNSTVASATLSSDFDAFIQLLTTQVTNQDPTQPLDSAQFIDQLATFSSLEQQVATNSHLETIISMIQSDSSGASSLLNRQVAAPAISAGGPFTAMPITAPDVTEGALVVRNSAGEEVYRGESSDAWSWDGTTTDGNAVPNDTYTFEIAAPDGDVAAVAVGTVDRVIITQGAQHVGLGDGVTASSYVLF